MDNLGGSVNEIDSMQDEELIEQQKMQKLIDLGQVADSQVKINSGELQIEEPREISIEEAVGPEERKSVVMEEEKSIEEEIVEGSAHKLSQLEIKDSALQNSAEVVLSDESLDGDLERNEVELVN